MVRRVNYESIYGPRRAPLGAYPIAFGIIAALSFINGVIADGHYGAERAAVFLEQGGYKDVQLADTEKMFVGLRGCDMADGVGYEFTATALNGDEVGRIVCKGIFNGAVLREE